MATLPAEIYAADADTLYVNQFIGSRARFDVGPAPVEVRMASRYTKDGSVRIGVHPELYERVERALPALFSRSIRIAPSRLGDRAGLIGAVHAAAQGLRQGAESRQYALGES